MCENKILNENEAEAEDAGKIGSDARQKSVTWHSSNEPTLLVESCTRPVRAGGNRRRVISVDGIW